MFYKKWGEETPYLNQMLINGDRITTPSTAISKQIPASIIH